MGSTVKLIDAKIKAYQFVLSEVIGPEGLVISDSLREVTNHFIADLNQIKQEVIKNERSKVQRLQTKNS